MKNPSKNAYLTQLKNGRLKFFTKLYLRHCGRRDARKKIIRTFGSGGYISPFINQEIYIYKLALQIEEECFIKSTMLAKRNIEVLKLQIDQKEQMIILSSSNENSDIEQTINILRSKALELSLFINKEKEIKQLRCQQLYNMLNAKILAYWDGVLQVYDENSKVPPIVNIDHLIQGGEHIHETK